MDKYIPKKASSGKTFLCDWWNATVEANDSKIFAAFSKHIAGEDDRHGADDIDYSEDKTVKQAVDDEASSRKSADTQMQTQITGLSNSKVDKVEGKGLSSNDLTDKHLLTLNKFDGYDTHVEFNADSLVMTGHTLFMPNIKSATGVDCEGEVISKVAGITHKLSEKASVSDIKDARPYVEYALPTTGALSLNTVYNIGLQTNINITLPTAQIGNFIQVDFFSGATAPTVTVSAASSALSSDFDFTPEPNTMYSLFFDYGMLKQAAIQEIYGWRFSFAEYTYTPDESGE